MDTFITSRATQHEVNSLDKRLKMLLSRKRLNHNPKGIEGFDTMDVPNTDDMTNVDSSKLENTDPTDEATDYTETYEKYVKTQKEKWTNAFAFLTKADLKKPTMFAAFIQRSAVTGTFPRGTPGPLAVGSSDPSSAARR